MEAYQAAEAKTAGSGLKMDQIFSMLRCGQRVGPLNPTSRLTMHRLSGMLS